VIFRGAAGDERQGRFGFFVKEKKMPVSNNPILVVDDDPRWRKTVTDILTEAGMLVAAFATIPEPVPACRAAVLDVSLDPADSENREGLTLAQKLAPSPVILLSGVPSSELAEFVQTHKHVLGTISKQDFRKQDLLALLKHASVDATPPSSGPANILIVEDDAGWRSIYTDLLTGPAHTLHFAVSYGEARGLLQRTRFQTAIVDLHLVSSADPEENRDGFSLLRITNQRNLPTIIVSALGAPEDIDRAYDEFGVFAFIEKEAFDRKAFAATVAEAIRSAAEQQAAPAVETAPAGPDPLAALTDREREVLSLLAKGHTNRQIAEVLTITPNTVKKHVDHVLQKLGVSTRAAAAAMAVRAGMDK
jgi:DNA-binding NarL/FixJ family response regulator